MRGAQDGNSFGARRGSELVVLVTHPPLVRAQPSAFVVRGGVGRQLVSQAGFVGDQDVGDLFPLGFLLFFGRPVLRGATLARRTFAFILPALGSPALALLGGSFTFGLVAGASHQRENQRQSDAGGHPRDPRP